ncbi:Hpt domain-containing protein [Pelagicoccus enzymogenes]|uniref:Hpt domain-containing protein n=1 Tax=Pelagicoccus enzymogenes TaxID=2773457 RepID=UPI00280F680F|nr:Hpt domain-containing protein [Pelagicoccus enzymogenes]MDQ8196878.1 Hpt domain-containing protein [Pelagicoccus enzymogenes]
MKDSSRHELKLFAAESLLSRLMDDEELMRQVLQACLQDLSRNFELLKSSVEAGDESTASKVAHTLKGSAKNADLRALAAIALEIEEGLKAGDRVGVERRLEDLSTVVRDSIREVERYLARI